MNFPTFATFAPSIKTYQGKPQASSLLMAREGALSVYYAPFEWVNPKARVVLVGITPGMVQAANALAEAQRAMTEGASDRKSVV